MNGALKNLISGRKRVELRMAQESWDLSQHWPTHCRSPETGGRERGSSSWKLKERSPERKVPSREDAGHEERKEGNAAQEESDKRPNGGGGTGLRQSSRDNYNQINKTLQNTTESFHPYPLVSLQNPTFRLR